MVRRRVALRLQAGGSPGGADRARGKRYHAYRGVQDSSKRKYSLVLQILYPQETTCGLTGVARHDTSKALSVRSFRHKGLKRLYETGQGRWLLPALVPRIRGFLAAIDEAQRPQEIGLFPGWRLQALKGDLRGFWSISVSGNWLLIFRFEKGDAFDLDLVGYH